MSSRTQSPTSALIAHVEHLVSGSRVLFIGSAQNVVPSHLLARGARLVQVLDPDPKRVAHAAAHNTERRVSFAQLTDTSLRDSAFECAIVEDLSQAADPERLLLGVRRSIGSRGVALICTPASGSTSGLLGIPPSELGFDELEDLATLVFEDVILLGQAPFVGYGVVSLSLSSPPEPCLDNEFLAEAEDADRFIAVCGSREALAELDLEDMTIVQLPAARVLEDGESMHREREGKAQRRIEALELEIEKLRRRESPGEIEALTHQLEERDSWIRDLEARAANAEARVDDLEAEQERLEAALEELGSQAARPGELEALREELDASQRVATRSQKETRWAEERVRKLERELESTLAEMEATEAQAGDRDAMSQRLQVLEQDVDKLTRQLASERTTRVQTQRELEQSERELEETHADLLQVTEQLEKVKKNLLAREQSLTEAQRAVEKLRQETAALMAKAQKPEAPRPVKATRQEEPLQKVEAPQAAEAAQREIEQLERQLRERAGRITEQQEQMRKLEVYAKSLAAELGLLEGKAQVDQLEGQLDHLSQSLAEREADLVAAEWTIGELKQRLAARPS